MQHQLFFDVTELVSFDKGTGIQRVTRALLRALSKSAPVDWAVVAVRGDGESGCFTIAHGLDGRKDSEQMASMLGSPIDPMKGDLFLSVDLAYNINASLRKELSRFRKNGVGVYFVVHDLIPLMYPEWFEGTNAWFEGNDYLKLFSFWFECVSEEGDGLVCVSDSVCKEVQDWLTRYPPKRADLVQLGYFHHGSNISESIPTAGLPPNAKEVLAVFKSSVTFLMVGTLEPRKGHELALDAIEILWAQGQDVKLVFVGRAGWKVEPLLARLKNHPRRGTQLFWLDGISDEYLREVYMASSALLALSLAEGFGLPLVEAAHFRLPLIVRDIPVFREVCAEAATYFSGSSCEELQILLTKWLKDLDAGQCLYPDGMEVLSWSESARQLMSAVGKMRGDEFFWIAEK